MELYRIAKSAYISDLSGTGAKLYGGRWNRPGVAAVYTSRFRSLAVLELLVHFQSRAALDQNFGLLSLYIPDSKVVMLDFNILPQGILKANEERLWAITDNYFFGQNVMALQVPSVILNEEYNVILNPNHSDFSLVKPSGMVALNLDERFKNTV
jgi:RES domain-containing protein